ncbi:MAG: hypothetical protein IKO06_03900 [Alphaproteobacteria bacterium]|nr:hypothetical protein [Alphaproteobacteria bacterium]
METSEFFLRVIAIVVLTIIIMWLFKKLVESVINLVTIIKAAKDWNHEANAESAHVVFNKKTKKLENASNVVKLPF